MLGLILLLVLKVWSSNAVVATLGSTITLECALSGSLTIWQKLMTSYWSNKLQDSSKYGNTNTTCLTIFNIDVNDAGVYRCTARTQQLQIGLTVTVPGIWTQWSQWTTCSKTCGIGEWIRSRSCQSGACSGIPFESMDCTTTPCPVNGIWGMWGEWSTCSRTCDSGTLTRSRSCDNPAPAHGGSDCLGNKYDMTQCNIQTCSVNGNWGAWHDWNSCSVTSGSGSRSRYQECNDPEPTHGGSDCEGNDTEIESCSIKLCRVNGHWGTWRDWNSCSATCGSGSRSRYQECNNPEPAHGGSDCQGNHTEIEMCSIELCPVASEEENSSTAIGIGAGIGSTALVVGLLIVFIYILKRNRLRKPAESVIYDTAGDTSSSNSDLHIYDGLQPNTESPTHRQSDVNYVNMVI